MSVNHDVQLLTTGKAAELLGVTPDTVLRWIRKGRLPACYTAGGHCRIRLQDLQALLGAPPECERARAEGGSPPLFCWEYLHPDGSIPEACEKCLVYRVRAAWCFRLAQLERDIGHAKSFCPESCEECAYFRRVSRRETNVLVVSSDAELISALAARPGGALALRFARNLYEASAMMHEFRPAFVVLDAGERSDINEALDCLASDPRAPGLHVILAVRTLRKRSAWRTGRFVAAVLEKPFGAAEVEGVIRELPVQTLFGPESSKTPQKEDQHAG
ncbi:MAG: helix-turn-helix domain-containing protein [Bryobacteraceae bacterium]|nr:helix-turn-helix domain-containing protein [Bryobacteraceae bacterium]